MTIESCASFCSPYTLFGVEYGRECYCGNTLGAGSVLAGSEKECSFLCPGDKGEFCGAGNRLLLYGVGGTTSSSTVAGSSTISGSSVSSSSTSSSPTPTQTLSPKQEVGPYTRLGCYTEATSTRALSGKATYDYNLMTLEMCASDCNGYTYFGVEYGGECYCGNSLSAGSVMATQQTDCGFVCPGEEFEYCGAGNRLEMYRLTSSM